MRECSNRDAGTCQSMSDVAWREGTSYSCDVLHCPSCRLISSQILFPPPPANTKNDTMAKLLLCLVAIVCLGAASAGTFACIDQDVSMRIFLA